MVDATTEAATVVDDAAANLLESGALADATVAAMDAAPDRRQRG